MTAKSTLGFEPSGFVLPKCKILHPSEVRNFRVSINQIYLFNFTNDAPDHTIKTELFLKGMFHYLPINYPNATSDEAAITIRKVQAWLERQDDHMLGQCCATMNIRTLCKVIEVVTEARMEYLASLYADEVMEAKKIHTTNTLALLVDDKIDLLATNDEIEDDMELYNSIDDSDQLDENNNSENNDDNNCSDSISDDSSDEVSKQDNNKANQVKVKEEEF
ncbi:hypothetical protein QBC35DRAFT_451913 [Podospora australis]|uniref:Uncharacterized protein n=1 Tax=Podospora australis TaxID=1536484 RepID=A0AAN6WUY9_9PEZI|nr:hypothetical protein QBC35DRAFT_451913 [Podospora australis]